MIIAIVFQFKGTATKGSDYVDSNKETIKKNHQVYDYKRSDYFYFKLYVSIFSQFESSKNQGGIIFYVIVAFCHRST